MEDSRKTQNVGTIKVRVNRSPIHAWDSGMSRFITGIKLLRALNRYLPTHKIIQLCSTCRIDHSKWPQTMTEVNTTPWKYKAKHTTKITTIYATSLCNAALPKTILNLCEQNKTMLHINQQLTQARGDWFFFSKWSE